MKEHIDDVNALSSHTPHAYANVLHESNKYYYNKQLFTKRVENKDIRCIHLKERKRESIW